MMDSSKRRPKLLFYVQHLLGIGHLKRAALLVQACCEAGIEVFVVSGGEAVEGISFEPAQLVRLPAIRSADSGFSGLVDERGAPLDELFKADRSDRLLSAFDEIQPDLLMIESYPFGRRQLRWELKPLLKAAHERPRPPLVLCSLRDILQARKPERIQETLDLAERFVDVVLVHGDPDFITLERSFPRADELADKLRYTGYVSQLDPWMPSGSENGRGEVIVSAGGGAVGFEIMHCALRARPLCRLDQATWRFLVGPNLPAEDRRALQQAADMQSGVVIEALRPDFRDLLKNCRLSISQAGYNTIMDLLITGAPSLLVPFEAGKETEQRYRTERLAELGQAQWLSEAALTPQAMAAKIDALTADSGPVTLRIDLDGARQTARRVLALWGERESRA